MDAGEGIARPHVLLDTPSSVLSVTQASIAAFAGQDFSLTAQGDMHYTAAHPYASASGQTTSWSTHEGGAKVIAANSPVSLRAHTDTLEILADKDVTVVSVNDEIRIGASTKIELIAGQSSVTLSGGDIEFKTPGAFTVKGSGHAFLGGGSGKAELPALPTDAQKVPTWIEIDHRDAESQPMAGQGLQNLLCGQCGHRRQARCEGARPPRQLTHAGRARGVRASGARQGGALAAAV